MNSEQVVRQRFPQAEAQHFEATYETGRKAPIQPEYWAIYPAGGLGQQPIATGPTEQAAWENAAQKLS